MRRDPPVLLGRALAARERQLLNLLVAGKSRKEIAWELRLTGGTVNQYFDQIYAKTGVRGQVQIALWWDRRQAA